MPSLSNAERFQSEGIPKSDKLSRTHHHQRIPAPDLSGRTKDRLLHVSCMHSLLGNAVRNHFRIRGRVEDGTSIDQLLFQFRCIDQISIVCKSQGAFDIVENKGLCILPGRSPRS